MKDTHNRPRFDIAFEELEAFIAVAEKASFTRAASALSLTQSSISHRIRRLEEKLSVRLFDRHPSGVQLTPFGQDFHTRSAGSMAQLNRLFHDLHQGGLSEQVEVNLAATISLAASVVPPLIADFKHSQPEARVRLHDMHREEAVDALTSGICDLAFMPLEDLDGRFAILPLLSQCYEVILTRGHPLLQSQSITLELALRYPLAMPGSYLHRLPGLYLAAASLGLNVRLAPEAIGLRHPSTMLALVAAGLGILVLPPAMIPSGFGDAVMRRPLTDPEIRRNFGLVQLSGRALTGMANRLWRFAEQTFVSCQENSM